MIRRSQSLMVWRFWSLKLFNSVKKSSSCHYHFFSSLFVSSHWFDQPAWTSPLVLEVVILVEIRQQSGLHRMPPQALLGQPARCRVVHGEEVSEPAEVVSGFLNRQSDDRNAQAAADDACDVAHRLHFVGAP